MPPKRKNKVAEYSKKPDSLRISLKELAAHLGLSPTSLSIVLNDAPSASAIPQETKNRILEAAEKFNYRPNYFARSLRAQRSFTLGVIVPELSDGYSAMVLNGVEASLSKEGFFYLTASHLHRDDLLEHHPKMLLERQVEGIIAVDTPIRFHSNLPIVSVSGHDEIQGVTNVVLNHHHAAELGMGHLFTLGHRQIAFIKGQDFSSDTKVRWETIAIAANKRGIKLDKTLITQLEGDIPSPEIGYIAVQKLLSNKKPFTALFAFNDISAIGAIRALQESGLRVPEDVSVLGFDDIYAAEFHNPALTTIRQPLFEMGSLAAQTLLKRLAADQTDDAEIPQTLTVEPKLIVRQSTAQAKKFKAVKK
ncbi:MAG: LacI family DNA-binding transcriptional regulator [Acidobacteria bacterium]|jgi:LacI family transcriptional regulator|nr:LacI family DNA-binding transcriptional regulator [Acidobacteriota bacterium]